MPRRRVWNYLSQYTSYEYFYFIWKPRRYWKWQERSVRKVAKTRQNLVTSKSCVFPTWNLIFTGLSKIRFSPPVNLRLSPIFFLSPLRFFPLYSCLTLHLSPHLFFCSNCCWIIPPTQDQILGSRVSTLEKEGGSWLFNSRFFDLMISQFNSFCQWPISQKFYKQMLLLLPNHQTFYTFSSTQCHGHWQNAMMVAS